MDKDLIQEQKNNRARMDFTRRDLTDAENFMNMSRV